MADAGGCIELFVEESGFTDSDDGLLLKASNILFRGMWWCKLREALLQMIAGRYKMVREVVDVKEFAQDLVRGREVALECPPQMVQLDRMVCNVALDNAVTNAMRHGCQKDPQVKLSVEMTKQGLQDIHDETQGAVPKHDMTDESGECTTPVEVRFVVRNRANPNRPLKAPWSSRQPSKPLPNNGSRPTLSDGLGLQHISMAANTCGMCAQLWQQDAEVFFELSFNTTTTRERVLEPVQESRPFPPGLNILVLDDSDIARTNLHMRLCKEIPTARVTVYGKDHHEVEEFKQEALERGNLLIMDENLHLSGESIQGSNILMELRASGYTGFACIRSGSSSAADEARSLRSGAQWHVGKEVWMSDLLRQLRAEYHKFRGKGKSRDKESDMPLHNNSFASCED
uniref:Response regulatory domain-containing protein n=1 Tax=Eutreptiella gymnastica TaxID=73025 RepID=A0A7S4FZS8_9EUGL